MRALCLVLLLLSQPSWAQTFNGRTAGEWAQDLGAAEAGDRETAVRSLMAMQDRAVRVLLRALGDEQAVVRTNAARALGFLGATAAEVAPALAKLEGDEDAAVAHAAAVASIRVQVDAARVPVLIEALRGEDWEKALAAADVLALIGTPGAPAARALAELLLQPRPLHDRTDEFGPRRLRTLYLNVRASAARALASIGPVEGIDSIGALTRTLGDRQWKAREGAIEALGKSGKAAASAVAPMLALLKDDADWQCRRAVATALAAIVDGDSPHLAEAVAAMAAALQDQDGGVRRLAAEFLGKRGAQAAAAVPALVASLSQRAQEREWAAKALQQMGAAAKTAGPALADAFRSLRGQEDHRSRSAATALLESLAAVDPEQRRSLEELDALLKEREQPKPDPKVARQEAIVADLTRLKEKDRKARMQAIGSLRELVAREAVPSLRECLAADRDAAERAAAIETLVALDAEEIVPLVRPMLADESEEVARAAALALAMFQDQESMPKLVPVLAAWAAKASKDELWFLGLTCVRGLAPVMEGILVDPGQGTDRRWGATRAVHLLGVAGSAPAVARMVAQVAGDKKIEAADRLELLSLGLAVLTELDPKPHRELFTRYAEADETEVRDAALAGLAELGDQKAIAALGGANPKAAIPPAMSKKLEEVRLRMSQVNRCTLREVIARLRPLVGVPIELAPGVDPSVLDGRFGWYVEFLGYQPSALDVLFAIRNYTFHGGELEPVISEERILLQPPAAGK